MTKSPGQILAVMQDLLFMVQIQEAGKRVGLHTTAVKTTQTALEQAALKPLLIVIDLNFSAAEPIALIQTLKADAATKHIPLLAFVSHVQEDLRSQAVVAGCDIVVPRSAFARRFSEALSSLQPR